VGDELRADFYQWMFYLTSTVQAELMMYFYPEKHTLATDSDACRAIVAAQEARITAMFELIDTSLQGKTFLLGDTLSLCDYFLFMLSHWGSGLQRPPLSFEHLGACLRRIAQRDAVQTVCETEGTDLGMYQ
jgi:glutathione S-transferase